MVRAEPPRFCQAELTELARPAAAPVTAVAAAHVENPLLDERPLSPDGAGRVGAGAGAGRGAAVASAAADQADRVWPDGDECDAPAAA